MHQALPLPSTMRAYRIAVGHDGQRKRVAHMTTVTTATDAAGGSYGLKHPHDFTMKQNFVASAAM
jgi:hypothetical protein